MNTTEINKTRIADYNKAHVGDTAFAITDEWDESKHPRAANGQFGSGGAKSSPAVPAKAPAKGNTTPAAKKPAQAKSTPHNFVSNRNVTEADVARWAKSDSYYNNLTKPKRQLIANAVNAYTAFVDAVMEAEADPQNAQKRQAAKSAYSTSEEMKAKTGRVAGRFRSLVLRIINHNLHDINQVDVLNKYYKLR